MASNRRILNITNGYRLKPLRADREVKECTAMWVEPGVTIRNLTGPEMVEAMNKRAQERDSLAQPLAPHEIRGFQYQPSASGMRAAKMEPRLVRAATAFAAGHAGF